MEGTPGWFGTLVVWLHAKQIPAWELMQLVAGVAAYAWFAVRTRGHRPLRYCLVVAFAGALFGGFMLGVALRLPAWIGSGFARSPFEGGFMAYGALAGLCVAFVLIARRRGYDARSVLDMLAPPAGLLLFFARVGCFLAGCDFGAVTTLPWAVRYPAGTLAWVQHRSAGVVASDAPWSMPVHPVQIYEALVALVAAAVALAVERRRRAKGDAFAAAAATYALGRLVVEAFRGDTMRGTAILSTSQWLSLSLLGWLAIRRLTDADRRTRTAMGPIY